MACLLFPCYCIDFQNSIKEWIKVSSMVGIPLWGWMFKETERQTHGEKRVQSSLWTSTRAYISSLVAQTARTVDKAAISLPIRDTVSNCRPLTEGALPRNSGVKSYRAWRRRHWYDCCSRGEEKRSLIERASAIFCCPETVLLLWDTEWDEDIRGERGQAQVLKCWWRLGKVMAQGREVWTTGKQQN